MANKWATAPYDREQCILMGPSLDEQIASDDPIRLLDKILECLDWSEWECVYSDGPGRPPVHPRLLAGSILYGMMNRIRSSRDLESATRMRIDFHWFLDGRHIDHSTFARFRNRFSEQIEGLLKDLNREARKMMQGGPKAIAIDGTSMRANSDRHGSRAAQCLQSKIASLQIEFGQIMAEMDFLDAMDTVDDSELSALRRRKDLLQKQMQKLEAALEAADKRDKLKREKDGKNATPVRVPVTDPDSFLLPNKDGGYAPNYTVTAAVDIDTGMIVASDVPPGGDEASVVQAAVEKLEETFGEKPEQVLFDSNFASGENLEYLEENEIEAFAPSEAAKPDNPAQRSNPTEPIGGEEIVRILNAKGNLNKTYFSYDTVNDCYYCPMGRRLPFFRLVYRKTKKGEKIPAREYKCVDCSACPLARKCLSRKAKTRTVSRDKYEPLRENLAARMRTDEARETYKQRAHKGETPFGCIKGNLGIRAFLSRGYEKVKTEWQWICGAYNMRKLMNIFSAEHMPPETFEQANVSCAAGNSITFTIWTLFRIVIRTKMAQAA